MAVSVRASFFFLRKKENLTGYRSALNRRKQNSCSHENKIKPSKSSLLFHLFQIENNVPEVEYYLRSFLLFTKVRRPRLQVSFKLSFKRNRYEKFKSRLIFEVS